MSRSKRVRAAKKAARTRKRNHLLRSKAAKKAARTRKRNLRARHSWRGHPRKHARAARKGWARRSPKRKAKRRSSPRLIGHVPMARKGYAYFVKGKKLFEQKWKR